MPRFGIIGDIHEQTGRLQAVLGFLARQKLDGVLLVGDVAEAGMERLASAQYDLRWTQKVDETLSLIRTTLDVPIAWVPGNHDMRGYETEESNVDGRCLDVAGVRVAGIGGAGPARFGFRYEWSEDDIRALELEPADILICHAPPIDSALDETYHGTSAGSAAIRERAEAHHGVFLCGHIHEACGVERLGRTCIGYNAGALGEPYGAAQCGVLDLDVTAGTVAITHTMLSTNHEQRWDERF